MQAHQYLLQSHTHGCGVAWEAMIKAGSSAIDIHFGYCKRLRTGEIMDLDDKQDLQHAMVANLLLVSGRKEDIRYTERVIELTLLALADQEVVRALAVTDIQVSSAYMATKDRCYLERLSGAPRDSHMSEDLGL